FFQGKVLCLPGSAGFKGSLTHPYHLARENFNQLFYILVDATLVYCIGHHGARIRFKDLLKIYDVAMLVAIWFAIFVSLWQLSSLNFGVPYPRSFFYSNAGYANASGQDLDGIARVCGPFNEPSALGYAFTGFLLFAWLRYRLHPSVLSALTIAA